MNKLNLLLLLSFCFTITLSSAQKKKKADPQKESFHFQSERFNALKFRNIGPFRGGRSNAVAGVSGDPQTYYFGSTGGGIWKTSDAGITWMNISDGHLKSGSVGAIAVAKSDPNVIYAGTGEHAVRGVMTSHGDGVYKSTDAGKTWKHIGLGKSRHISAVRIHPADPDVVFVAVQGALYAPGKAKGIYKTENGGETWELVLFVDENTGASDLSMDITNPRILYAGMWDHQRTPWQIRSGGPGSGIYKTTDSGKTWEKLEKGLPELMGKVAVDVSPADPQRVYANIEAEKGGVFRSEDGGQSWTQTNSQRVTVARAWYYIEIFADPQNAETVYVLNAPMLKSIDGGKTFQPIANPHTDQHDLWINPQHTQNMILANDGGACITFNGGKSWSPQNNQPTAQFYRVITDNRFPYHVYGGQQDNSAIAIASRDRGGYLGESDWYSVAGGESAFLAFDENNPRFVYGTSIQGSIDVYDHKTEVSKDIWVYPQLNLGTLPKDMKYRFNWNNPIVAQPQNPEILYYGAQIVFKTDNRGHSWTEISPDLTRNDTAKHGDGGIPFTNEAAGGEVYNTISYLACSPHTAGEIWVGTDDGLVHLTSDEGKHWANITPPGLPESLINAIEVSPHDRGTAYLAVTRYKFDDLSPMLYKTTDYGKNWTKMVKGIPDNVFVRVVREDRMNKNLLYAGTENGLYLSFDGGENWAPFQSNLPVSPITDLCSRDNDLIVATSGRAFWILDDLGALQQSLGKPDTSSIQLFKPKTSYKFTLNAPAQPSAFAGQNPLNGLIIDYYLPHDWVDSNQLEIQIFDQNRELLRKLSNQKPKDFKSWSGGPPPPSVIPSKSGLNRTNWDLRRETLPAIEGVFVMGDYRGHTVAPGDYFIRLVTTKDTIETSCTIKADSRLTASMKDHEEQQELLLQIESAVRDLHESVNLLRSVKTQLKERIELLKNINTDSTLIVTGEKALENITAWEENLIQPKQETFQDVINFRNKLNAELLNLKSQIEDYEARPTEGVKIRLKDLLSEWEHFKKQMLAVIDNEITDFNDAYQKAGLPVLILPTKE